MQNLNNTTFGNLARDNILKYLITTDTAHEIKINLVQENNEKYIEFQLFSKIGELLDSDKILLGSNLRIETDLATGNKILNATGGGGGGGDITYDEITE